MFLISISKLKLKLNPKIINIKMSTPLTKEQVLAEVETAPSTVQNAFWEIIELRKTLDNLNLDVVISLGYLKLALGDEFNPSLSTYTQTIKKAQEYFSQQGELESGKGEQLLLAADETDLLTIRKKISQRIKQRDIITSFLSKALGKKFAPSPNFTSFMLYEVINKWGTTDDKETEHLYQELLKKS